jgi:hypothetical protein
VSRFPLSNFEPQPCPSIHDQLYLCGNLYWQFVVQTSIRKVGFCNKYIGLTDGFILSFAASHIRGLQSKTFQFIANCRAGQAPNTVDDDEMSSLVTSPRPAIQSQKSKPEFFIMFEGFWLILRSPYLIYISLFLWLSAVVSSVFYFQVRLFCICVLPCIIELVSLLYMS